MKKLLLSLVAGTLVAGSAAALTPERFGVTLGSSLDNKVPSRVQAPHAPLAAETGYNLKFCGDLYSWYYMAQKNKLTYDCYIEITPEIADQLAGNKITDITFSCATILSGSVDGYVYVKENVDGDPVTATDCKIIDSYTQSQKGGTPYQTIKLDTPYEIKAGTGFYFGYVAKTCKYSKVAGADYPVGIDNNTPTAFAGTVKITDANGALYGSVDMATDLGTNLFLSAKTEGEKTGIDNVFTVVNVLLGDFTLPVTKASDSNYIYLGIRNIGTNALTSAEYTVAVNGGEPQTYTAAIDIAGQQAIYAGVPAPQLPVGRNILDITVDKINGKECDYACQLECITLGNDGYERNIVVEEGTGAWCGWCPRGIVGMETMAEEHPEKFIGIAVHYDDELEAESYTPFIQTYISGFPYAIINRDPVFGVDPSFEELEDCFQYWSTQAGAAKVDLAVEYNAENSTLTAKTATTFAFGDDAHEYLLAFVVTEDGLMEYQNNYYSGRTDLPWWINQGDQVLWTYSDTARLIEDAFGLEGSLPSAIEADKAYNTTHDIAVADVVEDVEKTAVIAIILDKTTGTILNGAKVVAANYTTAGVEGIIDDAQNAAPVYYNLQGIRIDRPTEGLFIKVQGTKSSKVVL